MSRKALRAVRENALCALAAAAGTAAMAWLGLYGFAWTDYEVEARVPLQALVAGHVAKFLQLAPAYGGSLVLRAPFALLADVWGGGELAVYRLVALPCLLAAAALGTWLVSEMRRRRRPPLGRGLALALCVASPLTLGALEVGHPEDLLGGALCVAAVLLAARGRALWAGALLGAAIANKEWALLALAPVLFALPSRRLPCVLSAVGAAGAILAPPALVHTGGFLVAARATATPSSSIFQPWQAWWFLGHHGAVVRGTFGRIKPGYRTGPGWVGTISHPLVLAALIPIAGPLWWRSRRSAAQRRRGERKRFGWDPTRGSGEGRRVGARVLFSKARRTRARARRGAIASEREALLLLALLMLARCMLDTWDTVYYALPLLLALTAWEALGERGLPVLALTGTALAWIDFEWLRIHASADVQAAFFLAWTLPLATGLALALYAPGTLTASAARVRVTRRLSAPWAAH
jgi:Glycosyltransferase family 87